KHTAEYPALVIIVREGLGLSQTEFRTVEHALSTEWESIGLTPLIMQDFSDVARIIRELQHINSPGYASPNDRTQQVWEEHRHRFDELQSRYSDFLSADAKKISKALDLRAMKATLWLAN